MYVAFVAGGIASGKSSFARRLQARGARRIDLDHHAGGCVRHPAQAREPRHERKPDVGELDRLKTCRTLRRGEGPPGEKRPVELAGGGVQQVVAVACPLGERRRRAIGRGMDGADFDARAARQPSDEYLGSHCDTLVDNRGSADELMARADAWWDAHQANGWRPARKAE